jgi:hypothetical protein
MNQEQIAKVCHEVNRAYCQALGDKSQLPWDEAPEWQRTSCVNGVKHHLEHPDTTPEGSHEVWLAEKLAAGWNYGRIKDVEAKTHPCVLPYACLTASDKAKDYIFRAVVRELGKQPNKFPLGCLLPDGHDGPCVEAEWSPEDHGDGRWLDAHPVPNWTLNVDTDERNASNFAVDKPGYYWAAVREGARDDAITGYAPTVDAAKAKAEAVLRALLSVPGGL